MNKIETSRNASHRGAILALSALSLFPASLSAQLGASQHPASTETDKARENFLLVSRSLLNELQKPFQRVLETHNGAQQFHIGAYPVRARLHLVPESAERRAGSGIVKDYDRKALWGVRWQEAASTTRRSLYFVENDPVKRWRPELFGELLKPLTGGSLDEQANHRSAALIRLTGLRPGAPGQKEGAPLVPDWVASPYGYGIPCITVKGNPQTPEALLAIFKDAEAIYEYIHSSCLNRALEKLGGGDAKASEALTPADREAISRIQEHFKEMLVEPVVNKLMEGKESTRSLLTTEAVFEYLRKIGYGLERESALDFERYLLRCCKNSQSKSEHDEWAEVLTTFRREKRLLDDELAKARSEQLPQFLGICYPWNRFTFSLPYIDTAIGMLRERL